MSHAVKTIAIVGGGTAGWLTAALIASHHQKQQQKNINIVLIEASDIPTVGVGEGTWPTMKNTLQQIGIKESDLFAATHAVFKQGGKFVNWVRSEGDSYYHPFTVPLGYGRIELAPYVSPIQQFSTSVNFQQRVCEAGLAPRTLAENEYQSQCNYAYHLDAGALAELLKKHCAENFAVQHIIDTVQETVLAEDGSISELKLKQNGVVNADLYVDCSGAASILLGQALQVPFVPADDILFNDSALAMHVPYESEDTPVACHTIATAQASGWIWDIGLTSRRGVGHVYSSRFLSDDEAESNLRKYVGTAGKNIAVRKISYKPGHREKFWHKNCVAVGMAAGFVEPLEATAIMLIELSARFIAENLPPDTDTFPVLEKKFNKQMDFRWTRILDFLKLHYLLSERTEPYWQAHRELASIPESLQQDMEIWRYRGPTIDDFDSKIELFPAASYQYVLYGMGFSPDFSRQQYMYQQQQQAEQIIVRNEKVTEQLVNTLLPHREYIEKWLAATHAKV